MNGRAARRACRRTRRRSAMSASCRIRSARPSSTTRRATMSRPSAAIVLGIPSNVDPERMPLAWRAIEWFTSPEVIKLFVQHGSYVMPRFSVAADPEVRRLSPVIPAVDAMAKKGQLRLWPRPPVAEYPAIVAIMGEEVHDMLSRKQTVRQMLTRRARPRRRADARAPALLAHPPLRLRCMRMFSLNASTLVVEAAGARNSPHDTPETHSAPVSRMTSIHAHSTRRAPEVLAAFPDNSALDLRARFRTSLRLLASTVALVTAAHGTERGGLTATAACSLSVDPPLMLVCVSRRSRTHGFMRESDSFCINYLGEQHRDLALLFAAQVQDAEEQVRDRRMGHQSARQSDPARQPRARSNAACTGGSTKEHTASSSARFSTSSPATNASRSSTCREDLPSSPTRLKRGQRQLVHSGEIARSGRRIRHASVDRHACLLSKNSTCRNQYNNLEDTPVVQLGMFLQPIHPFPRSQGEIYTRRPKRSSWRTSWASRKSGSASIIRRRPSRSHPAHLPRLADPSHQEHQARYRHAQPAEPSSGNGRRQYRALRSSERRPASVRHRARAGSQRTSSSSARRISRIAARRRSKPSR